MQNFETMNHTSSSVAQAKLQTYPLVDWALDICCRFGITNRDHTAKPTAIHKSRWPIQTHTSPPLEAFQAMIIRSPQ
jgi:hypothetical protein